MAIAIELHMAIVDHGAGPLYHVQSALMTSKAQTITATARTLDEAVKHVLSIWIEHSNHFTLDTDETATKQKESWEKGELPFSMDRNEYFYGFKLSKK